MTRLFEHLIVICLTLVLAGGGAVGYVNYSSMQADNQLMREQIEIMTYVCNMPPPVQMPQAGPSA